MEEELYVLIIKKNLQSGFGAYDDIQCAVKAKNRREALEKMQLLFQVL